MKMTLKLLDEIHKWAKGNCKPTCFEGVIEVEIEGCRIFIPKEFLGSDKVDAAVKVLESDDCPKDMWGD